MKAPELLTGRCLSHVLQKAVSREELRSFVFIIRWQIFEERCGNIIFGHYMDNLNVLCPKYSQISCEIHFNAF